ncbi:putative magnesium transporter MRS2-D isoform X1 [Zea mays]|uniref:putative magnesium transporter MRS2-D isoform X1 n=1 Tax=Zea mays TaxID=4577 RepID=UPI0004DE86BB|nr:putative magnesium transporter MRS2-D isoform X1 [Zea mays]|eukprot:XP_008663199.3 putative magnesium transporter MRS2-D isoform X1 [Zea mays]
MQPQQPRPGRQKLRASAPHRTDQPPAQRAPSCTYTYVHMAASTRRRHGAAAPGEWAAVSGAGAWRVEEVGKHQLMRRTGLPARDLRALDPALQFYYHPCSIVGRDRAVVVNLERARAVITATEVLVPAPRDPAVAPLFRSLRARLVASSAPAASPASAPPPEAFEEDEAAEDGGGALPPSPGGVGGGKDGQASARDKLPPFEFRALEVCLEFSCKSLEHETCTLEEEAYPALDELSSNISTLTLERVRQIKSRLLAISGRVQKVRDELEHLLDADVDMAAMHLSDKLAADGQSSRCNTNSEPNEFDEERDREAEAGDASSEGANGSGTGTSVGFTPKIDELENLLEAYFVQADGTLNKLSTLREYVDDTEDYINVMLDDKQNQLLQVGILLSTATLVMSVAIAITGVFGMNITIPLYNAPTGVFWQVTGGLVVATAAVYVVALICYKRSGILQ